MIAFNKFISLNIKQKIYKIASTIRGLEQDLKQGQPADPKELFTYLEYLERDRTNAKVARTLELVEQYHVTIFDTSRGRELEKDLNFCYHEILELINEAISEKFYTVRRIDNGRPSRRFPVTALLDNIRSPFNVGNVFRSADCLGVQELALCGITPHPPSLKIERTAMGTIPEVEWAYFEDTLTALEHYRSLGRKIVALETVENAVSLENFSEFEDSVFIFGNEEFGITESVLKECDQIVEIPMVGKKNSLNVANSFAIVFYQALLYFSATSDA